MYTPRIQRLALRSSAPLALSAIALLLTGGAAVALPEDPLGVTATVRRTAEAIVGAPDVVPPAAPVAAGEPLRGLFRIDTASCGSAVSGSHFRMLDPGGGMVQNADSACSDQTYTPLSPGTDGGLSTTDYQAQPDPPFDARGGGAANRITQPQSFFGANFATATNPVDPQTGASVPVPSIVEDGSGRLGGNLAAFAAAYQGQHFNQGAPKPDGSNPGRTTGPSGTYDPATRRFALDWSSTIVGGPFNNFTGQWHFEGVFEPATTPSSAEPEPQPAPDDGSMLPLPLPLGSTPGAGATPAGTTAGKVAGQTGGETLEGLFRIVPGSCATKGSENGSFFRMIQKGATPTNKTYVSNTSTSCADKTFSDLAPGTDGGLSTTAHQPHPDPPFKMSSSGLSEGVNDKITLPRGFFGSNFSTATNAVDPQTNAPTALMSIVNNAGALSGDTKAFAAAYQGQHFNQGSPKPDGSRPGLTTDLAGTYDAATKKFVMEWASTIVGGPFDGFTGVWHFEGTFEPAAAAVAPAATGTDTQPATGSTVTGGGTTPTSNPSANRVDQGALAAARTGPLFPPALGAGFLGLALAGRWLLRRPQPAEGSGG